MLEHADRDDPVVDLALRSVVEQLEARTLGQPGAHRPLLGDLQLLLGEGDPLDTGPGALGDMQGEAAPARADIEHAHVRLQQQLGGDMALLFLLRLLEALVAVREIGAGILAIPVEE
nr:MULTISPECIES: hypothetical protein [Halomonas]